MMGRIGQGGFNNHKPLPISSSISPKTTHLSTHSNTFTFSQQRTFEVHPFFATGYKNFKKKIYYTFYNLFVPGHERYNTKLFKVYNPWLYVDWKTRVRYDLRQKKRNAHRFFFENFHPLYALLRPLLKLKYWGAPKRDRMPRIFTLKQPERVQEVLPNLRKVRHDVTYRGPDYDDTAEHIVNLASKYYAEKEFAELEEPVDHEDLEKELTPEEEREFYSEATEAIGWRKDPVNPIRGLAAYSNIKINKKTKSYALREGTMNFDYFGSISPFMMRIYLRFPLLASLRRSTYEQFSKFFKRRRNYKRYLQLNNTRFKYQSLTVFGHKIKRALSYAFDKGDFTILQYHLSPDDSKDDMINELFDEVYSSNQYAYPLILLRGVKREITIRCSQIETRGFFYDDELDNYAYVVKFTRIYCTAKRKAKIRRQRIIIYCQWDWLTKAWKARRIIIRRKRRRNLF